MLSGDKLCRKGGILATEVSDDAKTTGQKDLFKVKDPANPDPDLAQVLKQEMKENGKQFGEALEVNMDLAKGAYGQVTVKKVCHLSTGREVAVKIIRPLLAREKVLKQAQEEMLVHQDLIHENVVRLYWGFEEASQYYVILELVPDGDLLDFLCAMKQQNIEEARTKRMFCQLIEGVAYKWTDLDKVKNLVKGLLKPVVADRWDLEKVKKCSWLDEKQDEGKVDSKEEDEERGP
jgi:hypothetical protein